MNILISCVYYSDNYNANGICTKNLAREMLARGHNVWIISSCDSLVCDYELVDGIKVYYIASEDYIRKLKDFRVGKGVILSLRYVIYRVLRNIKLLFVFPNNSPIRSKKVLSLAERLIELNDIDLYIGTYRPYESLYTGIKLKHKYGNSLKVVSYHLDLLSSIVDRKGLTAWIMRRKAHNAINREISLVDKILVPENCGYIKNKLTSKIASVGFPLYVKNDVVSSSGVEFKNDEISVVYIGSLDKDNRNPQIAVTLIENISIKINKPIVLHVWGQLWDAETNNILLKSNNVVYHGLIDNVFVQDILQKSDCLLNISNKLTYNFLPSKIFQYFAIGKPIINIVQNNKDCSLPYFEKYKRSYNIFSYKQVEAQMDLFEQFIVDCNLCYSSPSQPNDTDFECFTPSYICDVILN